MINVEFTIEDVWFDDYSSSFAIKLDTANIDTGGFILKFDSPSVRQLVP